jgi:hypothetical protein
MHPPLQRLPNGASDPAYLSFDSIEKAIEAANRAVVNWTMLDRMLGATSMEAHRPKYLTGSGFPASPYDIPPKSFSAGGINWRVQTSLSKDLNRHKYISYALTAGREYMSVIYCIEENSKWDYTSPVPGLPNNSPTIINAFNIAAITGNPETAPAGEVSIAEGKKIIEKVKGQGHEPLYLTHSHNVYMEIGRLAIYHREQTNRDEWFPGGHSRIKKIGEGVLSEGYKAAAHLIAPVRLIAAGESGSDPSEF